MERTRNWLKAIFITGYKPTQDDFADVFDTFVSKGDEQVLTNDNSGKVYITEKTKVSFNPQFPIGTNIMVLGRGYDGEGDVFCSITGEDHTGFWVTPSAPCTFVYFFIKLKA